jgi:hypothetical protein
MGTDAGSGPGSGRAGEENLRASQASVSPVAAHATGHFVIGSPAAFGTKVDAGGDERPWLAGSPAAILCQEQRTTREDGDGGQAMKANVGSGGSPPYLAKKPLVTRAVSLCSSAARA